MTLDLHQVTSPWSRTTDSIPDGERDTWVESLAGTAATDGDVTWKYAIYPETEWTTQGGDVKSEVLTSVESKGWGGRASPLFFPTTDAFENLVQVCSTFLCHFALHSQKLSLVGRSGLLALHPIMECLSREVILRKIPPTIAFEFSSMNSLAIKIIDLLSCSSPIRLNLSQSNSHL